MKGKAAISSLDGTKDPFTDVTPRCIGGIAILYGVKSDSVGLKVGGIETEGRGVGGAVGDTVGMQDDLPPENFNVATVSYTTYPDCDFELSKRNVQLPRERKPAFPVPTVALNCPLIDDCGIESGHVEVMDAVGYEMSDPPIVMERPVGSCTMYCRSEGFVPDARGSKSRTISTHSKAAHVGMNICLLL